MQIKYIRAKNFLSIGNKEPIEIDFTKHGSIVNIKGENRDMGLGASNGSGKTGIFLIIVYALYGKLIKGLNHKEVLNVKTKKPLEVEIHVDDYRIIRRRDTKGNGTLELWVNGNEKPEDLGGMPATQQYIVDNILKLSYQAFTNIVCFGQHMKYSFLTAEPSEKRAIAENLLSLDKYGRYHKITKDKLKVINSKIDQLGLLYGKDVAAVESAERQLNHVKQQREKWYNRKKEEIEKTETSIQTLKNKLEKTNEGSALVNYNIAQKELKEVNISISEIEEKIEKIRDIRVKIDTKINAIKEERYGVILLLKDDEHTINKLKNQIKELSSQIESLVSQKGSRCPACYGIVSEESCEHLVIYNQARISEIQGSLIQMEGGQDSRKVKLSTLDDQLGSLNKKIQETKDKERNYLVKVRELTSRRIELMNVKSPEVSSQVALLGQEIKHLEYKLEELDAQTDPYLTILDKLEAERNNAEKNVKDRKDEIRSLEVEVPYLDFWIRGFGDQGIRSFVLKEIIPILNARINYWLQFLVDNRIQISFNTELEEKIERCPADGDNFVYHAMSGGEHQRIDLAISQAFAHVMMLTSGTCPSIVCLDEVGTNLDRPGIQAIYKMICELARERQVLVTTHDPDLLDLLSSYDTITVIKENGFSKIKT
jgi:DNA repair exonuclease SbcCD ATPase subunit